MLAWIDGLSAACAVSSAFATAPVIGPVMNPDGVTFRIGAATATRPYPV